MLTGCYVGYVAGVSILKPATPARPCRRKPAPCAAGKLLARLTTLVPPLVLIFLVLGTIFLGIATPTEGGAMGATGAP
jgi:TRAP-type mannitol/chloroaromatic compound transport system permease large subunit